MNCFTRYLYVIRNANMENCPMPKGHTKSTHLFPQRGLDLFKKSSSVSCQFLMDPFTNPDTMMKHRTRTLMQVNILLTMADSFTPRVNNPKRRHGQKIM